MDEINNIDVLTARIQELEQQLQARDIALAEANHDLESFTYKLSHDLHAPLRAIHSYVEMIRNDFNGKVLDEDALRMMTRVLTNAEEMKQMLDGLLDFVRTGKKELSLRTINMNDLVKEICNRFQQTYSNCKLTIQLKELPEILGDEELIKKVWMYLIDNACKFSNKKEEIIIEINAEEKKDEIVYSIRDNGDGFDMNFYAKLFGVFQRLHHKTDFDGIGIGLATVDKIIARHKGKVWAEAKVKEGALFYFSLPKKHT